MAGSAPRSLSGLAIADQDKRRGFYVKKLLVIAALTLPVAPALADAPKPDALVADGIPAIPDELPVETRPYMEFRTASFMGWNPAMSIWDVWPKRI